MTVRIAAKALLFASAFMGFWLWVIVRLRPLSREWDSALPAWIAMPGFALVVAGAVGILVCVGLFVVRGRGTPAIFDAPRQFVAVGPYRYVRNPMYLSGIATFAGIGLSMRSLAVLVFAAAFFVCIHVFVLFIEEPGLRRRFGRTYDEYRQRVSRWVPRMAGALVVALVVGTPLLAQPSTHDFTGTWTLIVSRSDYGPFPLPEWRTDVIDHRHPTLNVTRRELPSAGAERTGEWSCTTDRVECTNTIGRNELKSVAYWNGAVLVVQSKTTYQGQDALLVDRWTLSPDRRVLTITRHAVSPQGAADQTFVLERN